MSGCCGPMCSKFFVIVYNIIFWISGCAMVGTGGYVLYDIGFTHLYTLVNQHPDKYPPEFLTYGAIAVILVGGLILFMGFFGCCGALQNSKCMLGTYIFFLILICFVEAIIALGCFYCHFSFPTDAKSKLKDQLTSKYYSDDQNFKTAIDYAQATFKCCGITGGKDYDEVRNRPPQSPSFPTTCCILSDRFQIEDIWLKPEPVNPSCRDTIETASRHTQGCWKELEHWLWIYTLIIGGTSGGLAVLQIFGVLFSMCLIRNIGEEA